jgi:hypothetical protein
MAGDGIPLANVLMYAGILVVPAAACWVILHAAALTRLVHRRDPEPMPEGPPIQDIAERLRRVHRTLAEFEPGTPMVRRTGTRQAYDSLLIQACTAMRVEQQLEASCEGIDRDIERLRIEESLRSAGLTIP